MKTNHRKEEIDIMKYKKMLTIMLALVVLIGSVTPVMAETRGDPIVKTIGGEDDLVVAEPPNMPGISGSIISVGE